MFKRFIALSLFALTQSGFALAQPATPRTDVPVRTVMLFSSGVGYFEHAGSVRGDGTTELRFKTAQINDILKSLVLQDLDGGKVAAITYPSQDPLSKTLRSFQVDITQNPSLAQLLNQLRGARVTIQAQGERLSGTVLGVETRTGTGSKGESVATPVLNVLTAATIRAVELPSISSLTFDDPQLEDELSKALDALSQARDQDKKPVTISFAGSGDRRVRIGYVVETPIWKTSYRLLLDDKENKLQGWAIVENQTESDWSGVSLSLVSGRPISFMMDLYRPLYATRPTVVQEMLAGLRPQLYERALAAVTVSSPPVPARSGVGGGRGGAPIVEQGMVGAATTITNETIVALSGSVQAIATAAQMGELFQYTIGNVTLARQKSAMLPIITDSVAIDRVSIFNAAVLQSHPLNGVRLKNTTGKHLLQGPVTVLDKSNYAGDARVDNVPPGQERLLSYGVDLDMLVNNTKVAYDRIVQTATIDTGTLVIVRKVVFTREYLAENKSDKDKTLIIEHPIRLGWDLVGTQKPLETTQSHYRFQGGAAAQKITALTVTEEQVQHELIAMHSADIGRLLTYSRTGEIPRAVRDALIKAIQLRQAVLSTDRELTERTRMINDIAEEQSRMRENMKTAGQTTQYYQRLLTKLNEQESAIEKLQGERDALTATREAQRKALEEYLSTLTV